jgi:hypothetical protein
MKLALLTNATAVDDAIRFVSQKSKENLESFGEDEEEEADGPDYEEPREQVIQQQLLMKSFRMNHEMNCYIESV